jgi:hypothetical protein
VAVGEGVAVGVRGRGRGRGGDAVPVRGSKVVSSRLPPPLTAFLLLHATMWLHTGITINVIFRGTNLITWPLLYVASILIITSRMIKLNNKPRDLSRRTMFIQTRT